MNAIVEVPVTQEVTPMQMLQIAVSKGADLEYLQKLMDLQERWEKNLARKAFDAAISAAKPKIKPILKNREVDFTSQRGRTNYVYEDFAQVASQVDPVLAEHGLSYRHRSVQNGKTMTITCVLSHREGHFEETSLSADNDESGNKNSIQAVGSVATYLQRYTLKLALGLAAAKDDDARSAAKPTIPEPPEGYDNWHADMVALSDNGTQKLTEAWGNSKPEYRRYVVKWDEDWWLKLKAKAAKVPA